jgi:hypothetical protein
MYLVLPTFPLAVLVGLEVAAIAIRLADRIAPLEDNSSVRHWRQWPAYFFSKGRWAEPAGDVRVYRPWKGDGIGINELGLRTARPTPNFGIEAASLEREIALLQRFRDIYAIDQVIFYTGANDAILRYMKRSDPTEGFGVATAQTTGFELIKAARRLLAVSFDGPTPVDQEDAASVARTNSLRERIAVARLRPGCAAISSLRR